jgi:membrane-associated phospholipid phosphatase
VTFAVLGAGWVTAVAYAALATKQHYVVDVLAGFVLALAVRP